MKRNTLFSFRTIFGLLTALVLPLATFAGAPPAAQQGRMVTLTGWLHTQDYSNRDAVLLMELNGDALQVPVSEAGRFMLAIPMNSKAVLHFEKPGHLAKEVVVDTRHARVRVNGRKLRRVRFAVILELERHMAGLAYNGPVGTIGFDPDGGCPSVSHHREMVTREQRRTMVF